jgi:hypothetical protein
MCFSVIKNNGRIILGMAQQGQFEAALVRLA